MSNVIDNIMGRMEEKAHKSQDYHVSVWKNHIIELHRLISDNEGGMSWARYEELKKELLSYAEASWKGEK